MAGRLIILCGPPASGKSTRARCLQEALDAVCLTPDDWMARLRLALLDASARGRVESLQWDLAQDLLARDCVVILDWGAFTQERRESLRLGARALGAAVELQFLWAARDELWRRIEQRNGPDEPTRAQLDVLVDAFEPPGADERGRYDSSVSVSS